jgi:hypothetical protein
MPAFEAACLNRQAAKEAAEAGEALAKLTKRAGELQRIIKRIVEQNALGSMDDNTFAGLLEGYQAEQRDIKARTASLENIIAETGRNKENIKNFAPVISRYTGIDGNTALTREMLMELIDKIVVHEATASYHCKDREQKVDVYFRFAGNLDGVIIR